MTPIGAALSVGNLAGSFFSSVGTAVNAWIAIRAAKTLWKKFQMEEAQRAASKAMIRSCPEIQLKDVSRSYGDRNILKKQTGSNICAPVPEGVLNRVLQSPKFEVREMESIM